MTHVSAAASAAIGQRAAASSIASEPPSLLTSHHIQETQQAKEQEADILENQHSKDDLLYQLEQVHELGYDSPFNVTMIMPHSTTLPNVKGRLKNHIYFWIHTLQAPEFIVDCIQEGYKIPFYTTPVPASFSNNHSALSNAFFFSDAISELLSTDQIVQTPKRHLIVINALQSPFNHQGKNV